MVGLPPLSRCASSLVEACVDGLVQLGATPVLLAAAVLGGVVGGRGERLGCAAVRALAAVQAILAAGSDPRTCA